MQIDPALEWQRLAEHYRNLGEGELLELASGFNDLTDPARQALRSEMQSRGLGDPLAPGRPRETSDRAQLLPAESLPLPSESEPAGGVFGARQPRIVPDDPLMEEEDDVPHEFTWKTPLCECGTSEEAWQIQEVLRRAGIESWIEFQGHTYAFVPSTAYRIGVGGLQVLVAADQLDQAQSLASQPIPQEIVEESQTEAPEFDSPVCPKCGAEDPILESIDPSNSWLCEQCGAQWSDTDTNTASLNPNTGETPQETERAARQQGSSSLQGE